MKRHASQKHTPPPTEATNPVWENTSVFSTEISTEGEGMEAMLIELKSDNYCINDDFEVTEEGIEVEVELGTNLLMCSMM